MKKIVFLDQYNQSGGGQTILVNLIQFALDAGFEVELWIPKGDYFQMRFNHDHRVIFKEIKSPTLNFSRKGLANHIYWVFYSFFFLRYLSGFKKVDYVYVNGPRLSLAVMLSSIFHPAKYYYHLHLLHTRVENAIFKMARMMPRTKYLIFGSEFILNRFKKNSSHSKYFLFNGFLSSHFSNLSYVSRFHTYHSGVSKSLNIMLLGRVYDGKGHGLFLKLAADFPSHQFYIIGKPVEQQYYNQLKSQATKNVVFSYADDVSSLVDKFDIHVSIMPSLVEESFGLSSIESMAMSCLTIVSDKGNLPYQAKITGSWVFSDYEHLKQLLQRIETMDPDELNKISFVQLQATRRNFGYETAKELFANLIH
jgi:glycosyltransferase involved in cell wall biosynthesis